jgi:hypothetical protein
MKLVLSVLGALVLGVVVFFSGGVVATATLAGGDPQKREPLPSVTSLWTTEPVKVDAIDRTLERLPARNAADKPSFDTAAVRIEPRQESTPSAISSGQQDGVGTRDRAEANPAHVAWCESRYRSFSRGDNSYTSFSGQRRACLSPFLRNNGANADSVAQVETQAQRYAATEPQGAGSDAKHVQSCFSRYRSYRPEDNSYQPSGGGARRQCDDIRQSRYAVADAR